MKRIVYELHPNGRIKEYYAATVDGDGHIVDIVDGGNDLSDILRGFVTVKVPNNLFQPRWNGSEWEEGETQEEREIRESEELIRTLTPSPEEIQESELEIKMITLIMELELI